MTSSTPSTANTRRDFLKTSTAALATASLPYWFTSATPAEAAYRSANERPVVGCIGTGSRWGGVGPQAMRFGDVAAVCDVDTAHAKRGQDRGKRTQKKDGKEPTVDVYGDYRKILDRKDIDVVTIVTPDHWHTLISVMALRSGKDVQCEKPTLTIGEGKTLIREVRKRGKVLQTSTEDRAVPVYHRMAELVRNGRVGKLEKIEVILPKQPTVPGNPTPQPVPPDLDYDMWLGPAPEAPYTKDRVHFHFRWIWDYSGGIICDWGTHLFDTAQWANNTERSGPTEVDGKGNHWEGGLYDTVKDLSLIHI